MSRSCGWLLAPVFSVGALLAQPAAAHVNLCLAFERHPSVPPLKLIQKKLLEYENRINVEFQFDCTSDRVLVRFVDGPTNLHPPDALGAIRTYNGELQPEIWIFYREIRSLLPTPLPDVEAQALATVTVHELNHWLRHQREHISNGLDDEYLSRANLLNREHISNRSATR